MRSESSEEKLDELIRSKLRGLGAPKHSVEPSADFTRRVMLRVALINRRRRWTGYLLAVLVSLVPLAIREIWMMVRGDYFSASSLPMSGLIIGAYNFFLSPSALYVLLALGILAFLFRANKLRRNYNYNSIRIA